MSSYSGRAGRPRTRVEAIVRTLCLIALVIIVCAASVGAESVVVHSSAKVSAAISLHNVSPTTIMWVLGLFTLDDLHSGNTQMWRADGKCATPKPASGSLPTIDPRSATAPAAASAPSAKSLPGIDLVVPYDEKNVLIVYGNRRAVEELKSTVATLDIARKQVQVKIEFVKLPAEALKTLDMDSKALVTLDPTAADAFRQTLREAGAEFVASPIISSVAGVPGEISISSQPQSWRFCETARVNNDGTITITLNPEFSETNPHRDQQLFTQRRFADGETCILGGFIYGDPAVSIWFLVTPKVVG